MKNLFSISLTFISLLAVGQNSGNFNNADPARYFDSRPTTTSSDPSRIELTVKGLANVLPEAFVATLHVTQLGQTSEQAVRLLNDRMKAFRKSLADVGLDSAVITRSIVSFVPQYQFSFKKVFTGNNNLVPDAFLLKENIMVTFSRNEDLQKVMAAAAQQEIFDLVKVDHFLHDMAKQRDALRTKCLTILRDRITAFSTVGFKLDSMQKVVDEDFVTIRPENRYQSYSVVSRPSMEGFKDVDVQHSKFSERGLTGEFYSPVSYDSFDFVINPVISEPVVQFMYEVRITFLPKNHHSMQRPTYYIGQSGEKVRLD